MHPYKRASFFVSPFKNLVDLANLATIHRAQSGQNSRVYTRPAREPGRYTRPDRPPATARSVVNLLGIW